MEEPPLEVVYQFIVPAEVVVFKLMIPASHLDAGITPVITGVVVTVAVIAVLVAVVQPAAVAYM